MEKGRLGVLKIMGREDLGLFVRAWTQSDTMGVKLSIAIVSKRCAKTMM
jgi:hypothetical protein